MIAKTLVVFRYDLKHDRVDKDFDDITLDDLAKTEQDVARKKEITMFICTKTNQTKILANRYGNIGKILNR